MLSERFLCFVMLVMHILSNHCDSTQSYETDAHTSDCVSMHADSLQHNHNSATCIHREPLNGMA